MPENVGDRIIVDLRWFALIEPRPENLVKFEPDKYDMRGMPQPTFEFELTPDDARNASEPRFMNIGSSLHIMVRLSCMRLHACSNNILYG